MTNVVKITRDAPEIVHTKLDRLWLTREPDGSVSVTTTMRDPDHSDVFYHLSMTLSRADG